MITLYAATATDFSTLGLGVLADVISAKVIEERNGSYELELTYPVSGRLYSSISLRSIITAKPNPDDAAQPFRVYKISRPINGIVTINGQHISYDLSGYVLNPFTAADIQAALAGFNSNSTVVTPFVFSTARTTSATFSVVTPTSIRSAMGGESGSVLDVYGGEWKFDRLSCVEYLHRGSNRGIVLEYGKNITDLKQEENNAKVWTAVYPFWRSSGEDQTLVVLPEKTVAVSGTFNYTRIMPLDLSSSFDEQPTEAQLRTKAQAYITNNGLGVPEVSISVSFQSLRETEEYRTLALLETIKLCDTVGIRFSKLGVNATAKVVKTVYDAVGEKFISIDVGSVKTTLADTIVSISETAESKPTTAQLLNAANVASQLITGNRGGYVRLHDSDGDGYPDEILVMDTADITTATKVWRWNLSGWGYSNTGYSGTYSLAATMNGEINGSFIKAGTIQAAYINGDGLNVSNATIDTCTINSNCTILGSLVGNSLASNTDGGTTGSLTFNQYGYQIEAISGADEMRLSVGFTSGSKYAVLGASIGVPVMTMLGDNVDLSGHQVNIYTDGNAGDQVTIGAVDLVTIDANSVLINNSPAMTKKGLKQLGVIQEWQWNSNVPVTVTTSSTWAIQFYSNGSNWTALNLYTNGKMRYRSGANTWTWVTDANGDFVDEAYRTMLITYWPNSAYFDTFITSNATKITT